MIIIKFDANTIYKNNKYTEKEYVPIIITRKKSRTATQYCSLSLAATHSYIVLFTTFHYMHGDGLSLKDPHLLEYY